MTARELLAAYAARQISPVEVVADAGARIEADELGAFWALCLERAAEEARAAETAWARGQARPLEGVPVAVKDLFDTAGVETTYGSPMFRGHVPDRDAEAVARVRAAGGIVVGKTATHEFAWGLSSINPRMGTSRNPRDPQRITGGSSGGSAAALTGGLVPLALGTDTGGSIRLPAAFCGAVGLKPTWGRVSLEGVWPLAPSLDHAGPMATTAADAALLYDVLAGESREEGWTMTVGVCAALGMPEAPPPDAREVAFPEAELVVPTFRAIQLAESLQTHRRAGLYPARRDEYADDVGHRLDVATEVGLDEYLDATLARGRLRVAFERVFEEVDVLLTPVAAIPPPRFDDASGLAGLREAVLPYTAPQDLAGLPACAVGSGMQVTGPPGAESRVLAMAATLS